MSFEQIMKVSEQPLISFVMIAYNQEQFIKEAIGSAFSQTYNNLEIVLSDDCSLDRTYEIMEEMVLAYKGPHKIIINRNPNNLGIAGNVNRCMDLSSGGLIIIAEGDDISASNRASILSNEWIRSEGKAKLLYSDAWIINSSGAPSGSMCREIGSDLIGIIQHESMIVGCSQAWDRSVFDFFGPLETDVVAGDVVIPFRALLMKGVYNVNEKLVSYRLCESDWKFPVAKAKNIPLIEFARHRNGIVKQASYRQILKDIEKARGILLCEQEYQQIKKVVCLKLSMCDLFVNLIDNGLTEIFGYYFKNKRLGRPEMRVLKRYLKLRCRL